MENKKYEINENIIKNYVKNINSIIIPMSEIKQQMIEPYQYTSNVIAERVEPYEIVHNKMNKSMEPNNTVVKSIIAMSSEIKKMIDLYPREKMNIGTELIRSIMRENNGVISTKMIEPLNISRQCLSMLEKNNEIERIERGIYISKDTIQDDFYAFQLKYKKSIFSHMNALYFYGMTEEIPYNFTVTVSNGYHDDSVNEKCNVFYVDEKIYELGLSEVKTPNGNTVRAYDIDRCICDIIRSKNRMDFEQVKKSVRAYVKRKDKNMVNLSKYAKEMKITNEVMEMVGMYYE